MEPKYSNQDGDDQSSAHLYPDSPTDQEPTYMDPAVYVEAHVASDTDDIVEADYAQDSKDPAVELPDTQGIHRFDAGLMKPLIAGMLLTLGFYAFLTILEALVGHPVDFITKLTDRGWTPYAAVLLTWWALSSLIFKLLLVYRRRQSLDQVIFPVDLRLDSDAAIDKALEATRRIAKQVQDRLLTDRLFRALALVKATRSSKEVRTLLTEDSDADYEAMENSYSLVRAFLWIIPILGFIGTVLGVGVAVSGFASFLSQAQEIDQIKEALTAVTSSLGVAFDTTLVALVLSVIVMIVMSAVEKVERDLLLAYDEYGRVNILQRIPSQQEVPAPIGVSGIALSMLSYFKDIFPQTLSTALQDALRAEVPGLSFWRDEAEQLAVQLATSVAAPWQAAQQAWQTNFEAYRHEVTAQEARLQETQATLTAERQHLQQELASQMARAQAQLTTEQEQVKAMLLAQSEAVGEQQATVQQYTSALATTSSKLEALIALQHKLEDGLLRAAGSDGLAAVLQDVRLVLNHLTQSISKPLDVEVHFSATPILNGEGKSHA